MSLFNFSSLFYIYLSQIVMTGKTLGEMCNGIAYIDWAKMNTPAAVHSDVMRCVGRYRRFELTSHSPSDFPESTNSSVSSKFVRSLGSTAIIYSEPDANGRRIGRAQAIDPWSRSGVEVGPGEESLINFFDRLRSQGHKKVLVEPMHALMERSLLVAQRSTSLLKSSILPIADFLKKMNTRVPELAERSYDLATSIRIEIKIEEEE